MRQADMIGGLLAVFLGGLAVHQSSQMEYWSSFGPGPGFIPLWSGVLIAIGGLLLTFQAWKRAKDKAPEKDPQQRYRLIQVAVVAALTMVLAVAVDFVGFSLPTFVFLAFLTGWLGDHKLVTTLTVSAGLTATFHFVFGYFLEVPLPKGWIGF